MFGLKASAMITELEGISGNGMATSKPVQEATVDARSSKKDQTGANDETNNNTDDGNKMPNNKIQDQNDPVDTIQVHDNRDLN